MYEDPDFDSRIDHVDDTPLDTPSWSATILVAVSFAALVAVLFFIYSARV